MKTQTTYQARYEKLRQAIEEIEGIGSYEREDRESVRELFHDMYDLALKTLIEDDEMEVSDV